MMNTRCTKLSMVRDDAKSSETSNKKCPVVLHGDHIHIHVYALKSVDARSITVGDVNFGKLHFRAILRL